MKDILLITRSKKGDARAFGELYDAYVAPIYRFILVKVSNRADAEDLTHQVFMSAWQHIQEYEAQGHPFSSWLYRIAHNAVIDFYRTRRYHADIDALPENTFAEHPEFVAKLDNALQVRLVKDAMRFLDHEQQTVLLMKFVNDMGNKEIAAALEKSEGAVRVMQHRALKQLKGIIEKTNGTSGTHTPFKDA